MSQRLQGVFLVLVSAVSYGTMATFASTAYASGTDPTTLLLLRFAIAGLLLLSMAIVGKVAMPRGRALGLLVLMGGVCYVGQSFSYFTALLYAPSGLVSLLLYLYPVFVLVLARLFLRERLTRIKLAGLAIALVGTLLTIGPVSGGKPLGILFGVLSAAFYSIYIAVGAAAMKDVDPVAASAVVILSAALVYVGIGLWRGVALPEGAPGWIGVVAIAVVSTSLAIATFLAGLVRVGPVNASTLSAVEPAVTVALGVALLGERMHPIQVVGGTLILAAAILLARARPEQEPG